MNDILNIELTVKSETSSDATNDSEATYVTEKFALYARYNFKAYNQIYSGFVFITYLFESKQILETGKTTITTFKDIKDVTEEVINTEIKKDRDIKLAKIDGEYLVNNKLNSILHYKTPYSISNGREKQYTVI